MTNPYVKRRELKSINSTVKYETIFTITNEKIYYGIKASLLKYENDLEIVIESDEVQNITYSFKQICALLNTLYNNTVTPCELVYILDDIISTSDEFLFEEQEIDYLIKEEFIKSTDLLEA